MRRRRDFEKRTFRLYIRFFARGDRACARSDYERRNSYQGGAHEERFFHRNGVSPFKRGQSGRGGFQRRHGRGADGGRTYAWQNQGRFPPRALPQNPRFFGARHAALRLRSEPRMQKRESCAFRADGFGVCGGCVRVEERESRSFEQRHGRSQGRRNAPRSQRAVEAHGGHQLRG